ncbi:MAG: hypothetical protein ABFQ62_01605 [Patescibacteria group bacterium]
MPKKTNPKTQTPVPPIDEINKESENDQPATREILHDLDTKQEGLMPKNIKIASAAIITIAVLAGIMTGFVTHRLQNKDSLDSGGGASPISQVAGENVSVGDVFGSADTETFKDDAQGYLEKGGLDGEGSHKLLRPGGDSQTVYLTSSVTDLDKLADMEVKVWGETFKAQKAGWLMDVGRVEVIQLDAQIPSEE